MPKFNHKRIGSQGFIRPWGADDTFNASFLNGYTLYIQTYDDVAILDPGKYIFKLEVEVKTYSRSYPNAFFELRIFNGTWNSIKIGGYECSHEGRNYKFEYQYKADLYRPVMNISFNTVIKANYPMQVQWIYHQDERVSASPISTLAFAKPCLQNEKAFLWSKRYTEGFGVAQRVQESYSRIASKNHYSNESNFPRGGRDFYTIGDSLNTDDIVQEQINLLGKNHVRILDLGTANGQLLTHLHQKYNLEWSQLLGVSAQDYRKFNNISIPDKSYLCYNIEDLYQLQTTLNSFSLIVSDVTWFYLADPIGSLEIVYNLLSLNGQLYLSIYKELATSILFDNSTEQTTSPVSLVELLNSTDLCQASFIEDQSIIKDENSNKFGWLCIKKNSSDLLHLGEFINYIPSKNDTKIRKNKVYSQYHFFSSAKNMVVREPDDIEEKINLTVIPQ